MKWKFNKTYVYYVPELDIIYTAEYVRAKDHPFGFTTIRDFPENVDRGGPITVNFNPDVLLLINHQSYKTKVYETVFIGVL